MRRQQGKTGTFQMHENQSGFYNLCSWWSVAVENKETCSDHAEPYLSTWAVNIRRILDLADVRAVVGELDLLKDDGGIAAHDVPSPDDSLPENAIRRGIWPLLVVEHLKRKRALGRSGSVFSHRAPCYTLADC